MSSQVRTHFHETCEHTINEHVHLELQCWYLFEKLAGECRSADHGMHGFAMYISRLARKHLMHASMFMRYQTQRGGHVNLMDIKAPTENWTHAESGWELILKTEKSLFEHLRKSDQCAEEHKDYAFSDFIEDGRFLSEQTRRIKDVGDVLCQVKRLKSEEGVGIYMLDKEMRENYGKPLWSNEVHLSEKFVKKMQHLHDEAAEEIMHKV